MDTYRESQRELRTMTAAAARLTVGLRYWLDRGPGRKRMGLSAGWGEVEVVRQNGACPYVRDCTDGDEYPVDPRDLRVTKPIKQTHGARQ